MSNLKPCPFRIYGDRRASLLIEGECYYREYFMPCMEEACSCFHRDGDDAYCDRNGAYRRLTRGGQDDQRKKDGESGR